MNLSAMKFFAGVIITAVLCSVNADDDDADANNHDHKPSKPSEESKPTVYFHLSNQKVSNYPCNEDNDWVENFDSTCKTLYIIPGAHTGKLEIFNQLIQAYLGLKECFNVIFCDWPSSYDPDYIQAAQSAYDVGGAIGQQILDLYGKGILVEAVEIVGHGLGAHVAGCAGKVTAPILPVDSIHALDPSGAFFTEGYTAFEDFKLTPTDATRVIVLHTSGHGIGSTKELGKYDFYANNGMKQPGIIFEYFGYYSHLCALYYFIESITSEVFVCHGQYGFPTTRYGRTMAKNTPGGKYYFKTNSKPPYGRN